MKPLERILFPTDFSEASRPAFEEAVQLARGSGAVLTVAHACEMPPAESLSYAPTGIYASSEEAVLELVQHKLREVVADACAKGIAAHALLLRGFPDEEIIAAATREKADIIVMGTHGRRGIDRVFLGSVAARVVGNAPCPVLTVRAARPSP